VCASGRPQNKQLTTRKSFCLRAIHFPQSIK
jgi:hypothetical protein